MTPAAALQAQIERYRAMTGEERLEIALQLHRFACETTRDGIRHQHPDATSDEVDRMLRERIALSYGIKKWALRRESA
jgi:hypothetical protein